MVSIYKFLKALYLSMTHRMRLISYKRHGSKPWSIGYSDYRSIFIKDVINSSSLLKLFHDHHPLPTGFGFKLDERVVEYPWLISRLNSDASYLFDAGSTLNIDFILSHPKLKQKKIVIYNLAPENVIRDENISYIYGDLRSTILQDELFDIITCISVLEHIGMDNAMIYSKNPQLREAAVNDYKRVVTELYRLLRPGGQLLLTMPYGRYENHGWLQQFDAELVADVINIFQPQHHHALYYKYSINGWNTATPEECENCSYQDVHKDRVVPPDFAAAARAVVCLEMTK